ncbi:sugar phosphate isomerase/epimerase [bacterium]|nr:sugar phosphate isomerase/epimerase [bacterium]
MERLWIGAVNIGIVHSMAYPNLRREEEVIGTIKSIVEDDFFGAIEVSNLTPQLAEKVGDILKSAHMDVIYAGQSSLLEAGVSLCSLDEAERNKAIEISKRNIDIAYKIGASILAVCSGRDPGEEVREEAREKLIASLKELCAYAQEKGEENIVTISLENFDRDIDKRFLIGPSEEAGRIAEEIKKEFSNFGLTLDLAHLPLLREKPHEALISVSDYLIHIHIGNCVLNRESPLYGDNHPPFEVEGGEIGVDELRAFLEALIYIGYLKRSVPTRLPVISFEIKPLPGQIPEVVLAGAKRIFVEAWSKI